MRSEGRLEKTSAIRITFDSLGARCSICYRPSHASAQVPFSLAVSTPTSTVKVGSELRLDIALTSTSNKPFLLGLHIRLEVRDSEGNAVNEIKASGESAKLPVAKEGEANGVGTSHPGLGIEPARLGGWSAVGNEIKLGTTHYRQIVNKKFDLSKSGTYTVQATQEFSNNVTVKSNTLTITVVP